MIEPDSLQGDRVRRLFRRAQELIRKQGIATPQGVRVKAGLITIQVTKWPPQSDAVKTQHVVAGRKWFPYRLEILQRQRVMMCVTYNDADEIRIITFRQGLWEYRVASVGTWNDPITGLDQQARSRRPGV
jgi:hypothetical protein